MKRIISISIVAVVIIALLVVKLLSNQKAAKEIVFIWLTTCYNQFLNLIALAVTCIIVKD